MFVDEWLTTRCDIDFTGTSLEQCNQLINECGQKKIPYKAKIDSVDNGIKYSLVASTTNEIAYDLIRDYKNRGAN